MGEVALIVLSLTPPSDRPLRVLCLAAHADDVEIGAGGTLLSLQARHKVEAKVVVFSADDRRADEQRHAASLLFADAVDHEVEIHGFRESFFPDQWADVKTALHASTAFEPDVVFTHRLEDRHQDHRVVAELTWQSFRDHLILQCEIPKYEGDLGRPNLYVPLGDEIIERKLEIITSSFVSQVEKPWFDADTFRGLARIRGTECNQRWAEGFHADKLTLGFPDPA